MLGDFPLEYYSLLFGPSGRILFFHWKHRVGHIRLDAERNGTMVPVLAMDE